MNMRYFLSFWIVCLTACAPLTQPPKTPVRHHLASWEKDIGYAQVVKVHNRLYISGVTSGAKDFNGQLLDIYGTITRILASHQLTTQAIVKETIYTRDMEALKQAIPLRKTFYPTGDYPSASWVQVERLFEGHFLLEIEVEAVTL